MLYNFFNMLTNKIIGPVMNLATSYSHLPLLFAFFLGVVGALAPCQLTSNVSAITIYGNRSILKKVPWLHVMLFILGKVVVFLVIGLFIWLLGKEAHHQLATVLPVVRKLMGPLLILIGLFMLGLFKRFKQLALFNRTGKVFSDSYLGSFLMGVSFTLAFCPTMFVLFILTLMPVVLTTSYGVVLPAVFGIGTSLPLIVVIFLIWYFGASGVILKRSRQIGHTVQMIAGILMLVIGILDTLTYWG